MSAVPGTEARVQDTARAIFAAMAGEKPGRLSRERLQGEMMEWAMADERLKVEMLRFVDVFPTLRSRPEIARHLREYFARAGRRRARRRCAGASASPASTRPWRRWRARSSAAR